MKNKYKVQKKQWNKWNIKGSKVAQAVFNETYQKIFSMYSICRSAPTIGRSEWRRITRVMAWNSAWIAAGVAADFEKLR